MDFLTQFLLITDTHSDTDIWVVAWSRPKDKWFWQCVREYFSLTVTHNSNTDNPISALACPPPLPPPPPAAVVGGNCKTAKEQQRIKDLTQREKKTEGGREKSQFQNKSLGNCFHSPNRPQTGSRKSIQHNRDQRTDFTMKDFRLFYVFNLFKMKKKKKLSKSVGDFWKREAIGSCWATERRRRKRSVGAGVSSPVLLKCC